LKDFIMDDFATWPEKLAQVEGQLVGRERRVSTAELVSLLGAAPAPDVWNELKKLMNALGWQGPKAMRGKGGLLVRGYCRPVVQEPEPGPEAEIAKLPAELTLPDHNMPEELARRLENATALGLQKLEDILKIPTDHLNGNVLRAQTAAAATAIQAQLRADENRLKTKREGDVMERLLKLINNEKKALRAAKRQRTLLAAKKIQEVAPLLEGGLE
jgi:hypothetical protein